MHLTMSLNCYRLPLYPCTVVDCRGLNAVRNGDIIFSTGTTYTSVAEVTCHEGYELVGSSVRVCLDNGEWAGNPPICRGKIASSCIKNRPGVTLFAALKCS